MRCADCSAVDRWIARQQRLNEQLQQQRERFPEPVQADLFGPPPLPCVVCGQPIGPNDDATVIGEQFAHARCAP
jgi:hypothetical protein